MSFYVFICLYYCSQKPEKKFLENLPLQFNRQKYLEVVKSLSIPDKTAEGYITEFVKEALIHRESQEQYINSILENKTSSGGSNNKEIQDYREPEDSFPELPEFPQILTA